MRMFLALDRQSIVKMTMSVEDVKERFPCFGALPAFHKCRHVSDHDEAISSSGNQDIQPLGGRHEADVSGFIASSQ